MKKLFSVLCIICLIGGFLGGCDQKPNGRTPVLENTPETQEAQNAAEIQEVQLTPYYIIIGDSYCAGEQSPYKGRMIYSCENGCSWGRNLKTMLGEDNCYISARGGAGFTWSDIYDFKYLFDEAILNLGEDKNKVTDVIACGGWNDLWIFDNTSAEFTENVKKSVIEFINHVHEVLPNVTIHIGEIGNSLSSRKTNNNTNIYEYTYLDKVVQAYKEACEETGQHYLCNVEYVMRDSKNLWDGQEDTVVYCHPNERGNKALAEAIYNALGY